MYPPVFTLSCLLTHCVVFWFPRVFPSQLFPFFLWRTPLTFLSFHVYFRLYSLPLPSSNLLVHSLIHDFLFSRALCCPSLFLGPLFALSAAAVHHRNGRDSPRLVFLRGVGPATDPRPRLSSAGVRHDDTPRNVPITTGAAPKNTTVKEKFDILVCKSYLCSL